MFTFNYASKGYERYIDQSKNHEVKIADKQVEYKGAYLTLSDKYVRLYDRHNIFITVNIHIKASYRYTKLA